MAKMTLPTIEQLELIKARCERIEAEYPKHRAAYNPSFTNFDKSLRSGIIFYSSGWGWRLRRNWREAWQQKMDKAMTAAKPGEAA